MNLTQDDADRLDRLRTHFSGYEVADVRALLARAFPSDRTTDVGALSLAEELFVYLELRSRFATALSFTEGARHLEAAVRNWFAARDHAS